MGEEKMWRNRNISWKQSSVYFELFADHLLIMQNEEDIDFMLWKRIENGVDINRDKTEYLSTK